MIPEPAEEAELLHRAARFERHAGFYGVPAAALDQIFTWLGSAYRLSGCAARRCKFPFTAERVSDGKLVKFPCKVVRAAFLAKLEALDVERLITALTGIRWRDSHERHWTLRRFEPDAPTTPGENLPRHRQFQRVTKARLNSRVTCSASAYTDVGDDEGGGDFESENVVARARCSITLMVRNDGASRGAAATHPFGQRRESARGMWLRV